MSGHTRGPWTWHEDNWNGGYSGLYGPNGEDVVVPQTRNDGDTGAAWFEELADEDRCLIAAAPDLLEELEDLVEVFHGYQGMELTRAKAAIAKAKGQPRDDAGIRPASEEA